MNETHFKSNLFAGLAVRIRCRMPRGRATSEFVDEF